MKPDGSPSTGDGPALRFPQTVSQELANRDFGRNPGLRRVVLASLLKAEQANARKLQVYLRSKLEASVWEGWLAVLAVSGEPVSTLFSLLFRELTGKLR